MFSMFLVFSGKKKLFSYTHIEFRKLKLLVRVYIRFFFFLTSKAYISVYIFLFGN